jgi:Tfp pilus assembly protein PilF
VERNNLGVELLQQGKPDAAIVHFQRATSLDSKYFSARLHLALHMSALIELKEPSGRINKQKKQRKRGR